MSGSEIRETRFSGGNFDSEVVRTGDTVQRRAGPWTPAVHALLQYLADAGFQASPVPVGIDGQGREVLSYLDGEAGHYPLASYMRSDANLIAVGTSLRVFHDLSARFPVPVGAMWGQAAADPGPIEVICHNDWAPYNAVFRSRQFAGIIDWDFARPGSRLWDFAWAAHTWVPLWNDQGAAEQGWGISPDRAERLRLLCDAYGLSRRGRVLPAIHARVSSTAHWLEEGASRGEPVFCRLVAEGHAEKYRSAAQYIEATWTVLSAAL